MSDYGNFISAAVNKKGVLDIDTVKGCSCGMEKYPCGGCYGVCYANKIAKARGFDFTKSVSRKTTDKIENNIEVLLYRHNLTWFRIGTMGDPSHDWALTSYVCCRFAKIRRPVVVTKHWFEIPSTMISRMAAHGVVFNTSISALDDDKELEHRLTQYHRVASYGAKSFLRVVTAKFGDTEEGRFLEWRQKWILANSNIIDTPLRIHASDKRVLEGTIIASRLYDLDSMSTISLRNPQTYIGKCVLCPDQCGAKE